MILQQLIEEIIRTGIDAGIITDEDRIDHDFIESLVHQYRAEAIIMVYNNDRYKRINASWTQQFIAEYDKTIQDDISTVKFKVPPVISLDKFRDGHLYIGTIDGNCPYRKVVGRAELTMAQHRHLKNNGATRVFASDGFIEEYGNPDLRDLRTDSIFQNPTDVPTYNKFTDEYPVSPEVVALLKELIWTKETSLIKQQFTDSVSSSKDETATPKQ